MFFSQIMGFYRKCTSETHVLVWLCLVLPALYSNNTQYTTCVKELGIYISYLTILFNGVLLLLHVAILFNGIPTVVVSSTLSYHKAFDVLKLSLP